MSGMRVLVGMGLAVAVLGAVADADAATARARCRVREGRVKIQVDGKRLAPGTYEATVVNASTGASAVSKPQTATAAVRSVDFDFDSTAQADDKDTFIPSGFAVAGDTINVVINPGAVASTGAVCVAR